MIDRKKCMAQTQEIAERFGRFKFLPKDATTNLRVLEFTDADGSNMFAIKRVEHRRKGQFTGKALGLCRDEMFGQPCAFCKANEVAKTDEFVKRTQYVINAIAIDVDPAKVSLWVIPSSVFQDMAEYACDDEWKDIFEAKTGVPFSITKSGSGLDTEYVTKPMRNAYPVDKAIISQVVDPMTEISDPGIENQCAVINVSVDDLFNPEELEKVETASPEKKTGTASKAKLRTKNTQAEFEVGQAVQYSQEEEPYHISEIKDDSIVIEDGNGDLWEVEPSEIRAFSEPEPEPEPENVEKPRCYGNKDLFDPNDKECKKCTHKGACEGEIELDDAGVGKRQIKKSSVQKSVASKKGDDSDEVMNKILGGKKSPAKGTVRRK